MDRTPCCEVRVFRWACRRPGQVAAFAWTDAHASDSLTHGSMVTYDDGRTWQRFHLPDAPEWISSEGLVGGAAGVVTLANGTIFVVDSRSHSLWTASGDWQNFRKVSQAGEVGWVQSNGTLLWASLTDKQIVVSKDAGDSWQAVSPG
jgi:hypothetical protein